MYATGVSPFFVFKVFLLLYLYGLPLSSLPNSILRLKLNFNREFLSVKKGRINSLFVLQGADPPPPTLPHSLRGFERVVTTPGLLPGPPIPPNLQTNFIQTHKLKSEFQIFRQLPPKQTTMLKKNKMCSF